MLILYTYLLLRAASNLLALLLALHGRHRSRRLDGLVVTHLRFLVQVESVHLLVGVVLLALDHLCSQHISHSVDVLQTHLDVFVSGV